MLVRLNKHLARRGAASRRGADRLIAEGRVSVNGVVIGDLGTKIDEARDRVAVDGREIRKPAAPAYWLLNKPAGFLVTLDDPFGRRTIRDLLPPLPDGLFPVGRLDADSEGLLLLTNDGDLAFRLTHPRYEIPKRYSVRVRGAVTPAEARRLETGVVVEGRTTAPARVSLVRADAEKSLLRIDLHEGRKREVRRMLEAIGHTVVHLRRIAFAGLTLKGVPLGGWRPLSRTEIAALKKRAGLD